MIGSATTTQAQFKTTTSDARRPMATITQSVLVDVVYMSVIAPDVVAIL